MADAAELVNAMKAAALAAGESAKPVQVCFGKVTGIAPLQILVEQKMTLRAAQLVLCRCVTNHTVEMTVEHYTENETVEGVNHRHAYKGTKRFAVRGALKAGEQVVLLRMQGGQKYLVLDRLREGAAG